VPISSTERRLTRKVLELRSTTRVRFVPCLCPLSSLLPFIPSPSKGRADDLPCPYRRRHRRTSSQALRRRESQPRRDDPPREHQHHDRLVDGEGQHQPRLADGISSTGLSFASRKERRVSFVCAVFTGLVLISPSWNTIFGSSPSPSES
jgi:hypothetical protein